MEQLLPCSFCGMATLHSALATFGARCRPCFDDYCRQKTAPPANPQGRWPEWQSRKARAAEAPEPAPAPSARAFAEPAMPAEPADLPDGDDVPAWVTEEAA